MLLIFDDMRQGLPNEGMNIEDFLEEQRAGDREDRAREKLNNRQIVATDMGQEMAVFVCGISNQ